MIREELIQLQTLLAKLVDEPDWNTGSPAWQTLVEAKRQVEIEINVESAD